MVLHATDTGFWRYHVLLNGERLERVIRADDQTGTVLVAPVDRHGATIPTKEGEFLAKIETLRGQVEIVCHTPAPPCECCWHAREAA